MYRLGFALIMGSVLLVAACGGGGGSGGNGGDSGGGNAPSITSVVVTCSPATVFPDQISTCSAAVSGTGNFSTAVTWSASTGSIDSSGLFTAPAVTSITPVTITATSTQDNTKSGSATVTVNPPAAGNNVQPIVVDGGPTGDYINGLFTSVKVCAPGSTTNCQTIDHVLVDTGAVGLLLLSTAGGGKFSLSLPQQQAPDGNPLVECAQFLFGFMWGPIAVADIYLGGEVASSIQIQVVAPADAPPVPRSCSGTGSNQGSLAQFGANGILGVGLFLQDCGQRCNQQPPLNLYYSCPSTGCVETLVPAAQQVQNPVSKFANDNNGVIIELPAIPDTGQATVSGWLVFGIGTQPNNGLGGAAVYTTDAVGNFTATYKGKSYNSSFIDSGSNGLFFLTPAETGLPTCPVSPGFYCPTTEQSFTVTNTGSDGRSGTVTFKIANAQQLFNSGNNAFDNVGGTYNGGFDYGLPFFFGRNVYSAIENQNTPGGVGPYWAY
ncbi:MAG: DUF3443 domain-containing protein [Candidatus Competibacteraceae bacterium]